MAKTVFIGFGVAAFYKLLMSARISGMKRRLTLCGVTTGDSGLISRRVAGA